MRLPALLLVSSLSLSLTGCCLSISGSRDSGFQSSRHGEGCQCPQHSHASSGTSSSKTSRPVRKTRPLFAGDRWRDRSNTIAGSYDVCSAGPCVCGGMACGGSGTCGGGCEGCGLGSCSMPVMSAFDGADCSMPGAAWSSDAGCHTPSWTSDPGCSSPAFPHSQFMPGEPGCNCGQHGPQGQPGVHGHLMQAVPPNPQPGSSMPAQPRQHGPVEHFAAPDGPVRPMPVPPAETPVPMPMPDVVPAPAPAAPVEQTNWEVPVFPPIP